MKNQVLSFLKKKFKRKTFLEIKKIKETLKGLNNIPCGIKLIPIIINDDEENSYTSYNIIKEGELLDFFLLVTHRENTKPKMEYGGKINFTTMYPSAYVIFDVSYSITDFFWIQF